MRGGVYINITAPTSSDTNLRWDNLQVFVDVESVREQDPEKVYYYHGNTKTKSQTVPLNSSYQGFWGLRAPLRPAVSADLQARYYGDCDLNSGTPDDYCIADAVGPMALRSDLKFHKVRFYNTRNAFDIETAMLYRHGQRIIDDDTWSVGFSHINSDFLYRYHCASNKTVQFGLQPQSQNWESYDNSLMPRKQIPYANVPDVGYVDCTWLDNELIPYNFFTKELDYSDFDTYCMPHYRQAADDSDPSRDDISVFLVREMPYAGTFQIGGFVRPDGNNDGQDLVFLHEGFGLGSPPGFPGDDDLASRVIAHEVGHTFDLKHRASSDPQCDPAGDLYNALMCPNGAGTSLNGTECSMIHADTQHKDYN